MVGSENLSQSSDASVRRTNDDASSCKLSAVRLKYYSDPYVHHFVVRPERKAPIINRGTYARVYAVQTLVEKFLKETAQEKGRQIVSLGAGSDTLFWRLKEKDLGEFTYVEVDFEEIVAKKCRLIRKHQDLSGVLSGPVQGSESEIHSQSYHMLSSDLRDIEALKSTLGAWTDPRVPTLFLAEYVLVYLPPDRSDAILSWIPQHFSQAAVLSWEHIKPNDPFGEVMVRNLETRQCPLLGIHAYPTKASQCCRVVQAGWSGAWAMDMGEVYRTLPPAEQQRISHLEPFDEFEEWDITVGHFCLVWAWWLPIDSTVNLSAVTLGQ